MHVDNLAVHLFDGDYLVFLDVTLIYNLHIILYNVYFSKKCCMYCLYCAVYYSPEGYLHPEIACYRKQTRQFRYRDYKMRHQNYLSDLLTHLLLARQVCEYMWHMSYHYFSRRRMILFEGIL